MTTILAIDPGPEESAYALIHSEDRRPLEFDKLDNRLLLQGLRNGGIPGVGTLHLDRVSIEMITSYGMPVGREVFDTCVWIGRFQEAIFHGWWPRLPTELTPRRDVKRHHCGTSTAKDSNVIQALRDRFARGVGNYGKGTKAEPGWFYGFKADVWQAYALAVCIADGLDEVGP